MPHTGKYTINCFIAKSLGMSEKRRKEFYIYIPYNYILEMLNFILKPERFLYVYFPVSFKPAFMKDSRTLWFRYRQIL